MTRTYCTILSSNYLPKALALAESMRRHEDRAVLRILLIDVADDDQLPEFSGVECLSTASLGLSRRSVRELVMSYDLVEFATAVKPLFLQALLVDAEQVVYLDPDTYVAAPMVELPGALAASEQGILLTPHFLGPPPPGADHSDGTSCWSASTTSDSAPSTAGPCRRSTGGGRISARSASMTPWPACSSTRNGWTSGAPTSSRPAFVTLATT